MPAEQPKEILIFGATGGTGQALVHAALRQGYQPILFVRDINRAKHLFNGMHSQVGFTQGDASSEADTRRAIGSGLLAVVSAMGIYQRSAGSNDLTLATINLLNAMGASGPKRFICISSIGVGDSRMQGDWITRLMQKTSLKHTLADKEMQEAAIRDSELDWTIIRPSRLINTGGAANYSHWTGAQPDEKLTWSVRRSDVADFALNCIDDPARIGQALNITGKK